MTEAEFRAELQQITAGRSATEWPDLIRELGERHPHSIGVAEVEQDKRFNCFAFALGLTESDTYFRVASLSKDPNVHAESTFVSYLIASGLLQLQSKRAQESVAVYFDRDEPTHAGLFNSERVLSKWGTGLWFEHALFEVPANYGAVVKQFVAPEPTAVEAAFLKFAAEKGVKVERYVPPLSLGGT